MGVRTYFSNCNYKETGVDEQPYGWMGKILRVDLSSGRIEKEETLAYKEFLGGRGIAAKLAWDGLGPSVRPFDPENLLIFMTGPLAGTAAPSSGKTLVSSLSPQVHPYEWFTHSSMGGHWARGLKGAGFDGIVITGRAERPVYLWVHDGRAEVRPAEDLWGLGTYATHCALRARLGSEVSVAAIGQAGENLCRFATIMTETDAAAGQGGFGAVMGCKKLKAIAVGGSKAVLLARPEEFEERVRAIAEYMRTPGSWPMLAAEQPQRAPQYGEMRQSCADNCVFCCARYYTDVPGVVNPQARYSGRMFCVGSAFVGRAAGEAWNLGFEAGFEMKSIADDYGLNHWEVLKGVVPWLIRCRQAGLIEDLNGLSLDFNDPRAWAKMLRAISLREGPGAALTEGGVRAASLLELGQEFIRPIYTAWGFANHWDGGPRNGGSGNRVVFPYWLVSALQWAMASRDPFNSGHDFVRDVTMWAPFTSGERGLTWEELGAVAKALYGSAAVADPRSGYADKALPAVWHDHRSALKDSISLCDRVFPRLFSRVTADRLPRAGGMEGHYFEHCLLRSATGLELDNAEIDRAAERVFNLERAIHIRHNGRSRQDDETVIPYFELEENWVNPVLGERQKADPVKFRRLMDEYYELRGWDPKTGRPRRKVLESLGLKDVADELEGSGLLP